VAGRPLISHQMARMLNAGVEHLVVAMNSSEKKIDFSSVIEFSNKKVNKIFVDTPSSLHTFWEISKVLGPTSGHILASMVDTIVYPKDFQDYLTQCGLLPLDESMILVTRFIDDEKPLTVAIDSTQKVSAFGVPLEKNSLVTSGIYCFSAKVLPILSDCVTNGIHKMRNFLATLTQMGHPVRVFITEKTIDIDRPEDLVVAEKFLKGTNL